MSSDKLFPALFTLVFQIASNLIYSLSKVFRHCINKITFNMFILIRNATFATSNNKDIFNKQLITFLILVYWRKRMFIVYGLIIQIGLQWERNHQD